VRFVTRVSAWESDNGGGKREGSVCKQCVWVCVQKLQASGAECAQLKRTVERNSKEAQVCVLGACAVRE